MNAEAVLACMPTCCTCLKAVGSRAASPAEPGSTGAAKGLAGPAVQVLAGADEGSMAADAAVVPRRSFEAAEASAALSRASPTALAVWRSPEMLAVLRGLSMRGAAVVAASSAPAGAPHVLMYPSEQAKLAAPRAFPKSLAV